MKNNRILKTLVAVACLLAMLLSLTACAATPEARFKKLYQTYLDGALLGVDAYYKAMEAYDPTDMTAQVNLNIVPGTSLLTMLQSMLSMDFSWVGELDLTLTSTIKKSQMGVTLGLAYGDKSFLSADVLSDMTSMYMVIPVLSSQALKTDLAEATDGMDISSALSRMDYSNVLPEKSQLKNLTKKYYGIVMENITAVTETDGSVTAKGISQDCLVYEVVLTQKQVADLILDLLKAMAEDTEIKEIFCKILTYTAATTPGIIAEDEYADFLSQLTELIASTEESLASGEITDDPMITWLTYASKKSKILGCDLTCAIDGESFRLFTATAEGEGGSAQELSVTVNGQKVFALEGDLTSESGKFGGRYELFSNGQSMAFVDLEGIDTKKLIGGMFNGTVTLSPSTGLMAILSEETDMDPSAAMLLSAYSLKLTMAQNDQKHASMTLSITSGTEAFLTVNLDSSISKAASLTMPTEFTEDPTAWSSGFDMNALSAAVQNSGLPQDAVSMILALLGQLVG